MTLSLAATQETKQQWVQLCAGCPHADFEGPGRPFCTGVTLSCTVTLQQGPRDSVLSVRAQPVSEGASPRKVYAGTFDCAAEHAAALWDAFKDRTVRWRFRRGDCRLILCVAGNMAFVLEQ